LPTVVDVLGLRQNIKRRVDLLKHIPREKGPRAGVRKVWRLQ